MKIKSLCLAVFLILPQVFSSASAATLEETINEQYKEKRDICPVVKDLIIGGKNTKQVVYTSIVLNYDACTVVKCSIMAGGIVEEVIDGAIDAHVPTDIITKCAIDAGARPQDVAKVLERSAPSSPPPGFPGGNRQGNDVRHLSPFGFR